MKYSIGIDAGSKTLKVVTLDEDGKLVHSVYRRHRANIRETMEEVLHDLVWRYGDIEGSIAITGSAGIELAELLDLPFVQEVVATTQAVQTFIPDADAIIELGGEDAKVVYLTGGLEQRMNATCAGGTGGFIDTIAFMLGVRSSEMSSLAMGANRLYPIASRCAVFAQTDVRPLLNSGAKKSDIAASALEAVVKQTLSGLACGRPIKGKVVFLGGPLEHIPDLVFRFRRALDLTHKTGIKPPDAHLFTAMGAALLGPELLVRHGLESSYSLAELEQALSQAPLSKNDLPMLPPLFESKADRDEFMERHHTAKLPRKRLSDCEGSLYLGIDAGSITVKFVVVDEQKNLVYSDYRPTKGDTLETASHMLGELFRLLPHEYNGKMVAWIAHVTVTGYGEDLLKAAFRADSGIVETVAHLRAAQHLYPETDFILDIGGQDMKALWIKNGAIENAVLNEACSSGCGSFIEGTAYSLHLNPYTFADLALSSETPVDLGMKCTVFMTSRVRHAQKIGIPYADIAAGLAYSVVKNALFKIIGMRHIDELGDVVVVQGGAFMSDAVLRAFELVSGKQVIRPDIAHLMGAYGAAITAAWRFDGSPSSLITPDELKTLKPQRRAQRCTGCTNNCLMSIIDFGEGRLHVNGNRCERALKIVLGRNDKVFSPKHGTAEQETPRKDKAPNLYELEQKLLARYGRRDKVFSNNGDRHVLYIGIPRTLNLYESLPFWYTLLSCLGFSVVLPSSTIEEDDYDNASASNYAGTSCATLSSGARGLETVPSESVCFPAKITHIHCAELIQGDVDAIFMPTFERGSRCPVSSQYASVLKGNIPEMSSGQIALISPNLKAIRPGKIRKNAADIQALLNELNSMDDRMTPITADELDRALDLALDEQGQFEAILARATEKAISWIKTPGKRGIVLAGRPYHVDRGLSHGIDALLVDLGFAVLTPLGLHSASTLFPQEHELSSHPSGSRDSQENSWKAAKSLTKIARYTSAQADLDLICLYSFGCGFDALSLAPVKTLVEDSGKIFTAFKIDEIVDLAHIRIRLRTLAETLQDKAGTKAFVPHKEGRGGTSSGHAPLDDRARAEISCKPSRLEPLTQDDIECARKYVTHDICFVTSAIAGAAINLLRSDPSITHLTIPYVCSSCLMDDIPNLIQEALGWTPEIVWESSWEQPSFPPHTGLLPGGTLPEGAPPKPLPRIGIADTPREGAPLEAAPRIGILGNAFLCFDEHANHRFVHLVEELGCEPIFPKSEALFTDDVRYIDQIESFLEEGVSDIVYLQAFGCLKGHINSRGALRDLQKRFGDLRLTIVDYDHDISALNQENRIRLALSEAYRHAKG